MTINFDANDNLTTILQRIRHSSETELELIIPQNCVFWQSPVNYDLLQKVAAQNGKKLTISKEPQEKSKESQGQPPNETFPHPSPPAKGKKHLRRPSWKKWILGGVGLFLIAAATSLVIVYYYLPQATVILKVSKKELEKELQVRIDPQAGKIDLQKSILPGKLLQSEQSATESFKASGSKLVGNKALGEVTLQNWTGTEVTFDKGTLLTVDEGQGEYSGLQFVTDDTVTVPPQSTDTGQGIRKAGMVNVPVTAVNFGTEYNLPAKLDFRVDDRDFSNFSAINPKPFSGGTTESVTIVTQKDLNEAQEQLRAKLFAQGENELEKKLSPGEKIVKETIDHATTFAKFNQEAGNQAQEFKLSMRTVSTAVSYREKQLRELLVASLKESVPEGFKLDNTKEVITVKNVQRENDGTLLATAVIKTLVVPDINAAKIKQELIGLKIAQAQKILRETPHLEGFEINLTPKLPQPLITLPHRAERLNLKIVVE